MKIKQYFDYDPEWDEIADEFAKNESVFQSQALNRIGFTLKNWAKNGIRTSQLLEIAEDLDDDGRWFIKTLCDYMESEAESECEELYSNIHLRTEQS